MANRVVKKKANPIAVLVGLVGILVLGVLGFAFTAWVVMLLIGAVYAETGWLAPISYLGAFFVTWLTAVLGAAFNSQSRFTTSTTS